MKEIKTENTNNQEYSIDSTNFSASPSEKNFPRIPCNRMDDTNPEIIHERQEYIKKTCGVKLKHANQYSFDPAVTQNNIEHFTGVAMVPLGIIGPMQINGEYAQGKFLIPMCTTEGTLLASHNRGIKVINLSGGVTTTVIDDRMQRAPVFTFDSARDARDFIQWLDLHINDIRQRAESTSKTAKLLHIEKIIAGRMVYVRFNYSTGDAAGQNMVSLATSTACTWIIQNFPGIRHFIIESNFATDKKASYINTLQTRGKRVVAEITIPREIVETYLYTTPEITLFNHQLSNVASFISGSNNNGAQLANSLAALFIATGQDVANLAESTAGITHFEITNTGDYYMSLTIPSLIVASYGGGTNLPTQRECLDILDCYGEGKARKLAEIITAVALAGEISLGAAISTPASRDYIMAHESHGRNR